jgi:murein L,D-transpeptidase YafK
MNKIIKSFLIFTTIANANILVDEYIKNGPQAVIKQIEKQIQSKEYWKNHLKDKKIEYGYSYKNRDYLVCDKSAKTMSLVKNDSTTVDVNGLLPIITGQKDGDKQIEGDLKTPIGTYDLLRKKLDVDKFYGPLAFVTSYPNMYDRLKGKTGYGIWIHGMPIDNEKREEFTQGCIALDNKNLLELANSISHENTLLLISENKLQKTSNEEIAIIMADLYKWREAWKNSDITRYLSFYDNEFIRFDDKKIDEFKRMKTRIFKRGGQKQIIFKNFEIILYPTANNQRVFKVTFDEDYKSKHTTFKGKKELYVKIENEQIKILAEK